MRTSVENGWELWEIDFGGVKEWIAVTADVGVTADQVREDYLTITDGDAAAVADAKVTRVSDLDELQFVDTENPERHYPARDSLAELGQAQRCHGDHHRSMMVATTEW